MAYTKEQAAEYSRRYYHANKHKRNTKEYRERSAINTARWRKENPEKAILSAAKARAKRLGYEFNIDLTDIIIPDYCPILDIPLTKIEGLQHDNSWALDRIDNTKGYVKGNVCVISHKANRHKADLSIEDIERLYKYSQSVKSFCVPNQSGPS